MITKEQIIGIIKDQLEEDDVFIVDLSVGGGNKINVIIDSDQGVNIEYCVSVSRMIEGSFDREEEDFELMVSSASLSEPFKVWRQYNKNEGQDVKVQLSDGRKMEGTMKEVTKDSIVLETSRKVAVEGKKKKEMVIEDNVLPFENIISTEIVIKFK